jgi:hypothetical protein
MMRGGIVAAALLASAIARAGGDPAIARLEHSLPTGWSLLATDTELVIRHDKPVYTTKAGVAGGPEITLELRYHLEPRWTDKQLADARATNAKLRAELAAVRAKYKIDGAAAATDADRARLAAYDAERARIEARQVKLPRCTLGASSLFDGPDTYAQLTLAVDPAQAMTEARAIAELVKKQCGAP